MILYWTNVYEIETGTSIVKINLCLTSFVSQMVALNTQTAVSRLETIILAPQRCFWTRNDRFRYKSIRFGAQNDHFKTKTPIWEDTNVLRLQIIVLQLETSVWLSEFKLLSHCSGRCGDLLSGAAEHQRDMELLGPTVSYRESSAELLNFRT